MELGGVLQHRGEEAEFALVAGAKARHLRVLTVGKKLHCHLTTPPVGMGSEPNCVSPQLACISRCQLPLLQELLDFAKGALARSCLSLYEDEAFGRGVPQVHGAA